MPTTASRPAPSAKSPAPSAPAQKNSADRLIASSGGYFWRQRTRPPCRRTSPIGCVVSSPPLPLSSPGALLSSPRKRGPICGRPPACKSVAASDRIACDHMSGLLMAVHMTACQDGVRDASAKQYCDVRHRRVPRLVSRLGSIDHAICSVSSKLRPQREAMVTSRRTRVPGRSPPLAVAWCASAARGAARSPYEAQRSAPRGPQPPPRSPQNRGLDCNVHR